MAHTANSIIINAPYSRVFDISNDIPRWTELFGEEYKKAEVVSKVGNEITFRLTDDENKSWVSKRWLFKEQKFAYAQRWEPMFPFQYMKIIWLYTEVEDGVKMTWIQDFEMDPAFTKFSGEQIAGFINKHSLENLLIFKEIIEREVTQK
ncbi:MAG: SRPBCC family protein [Candidatus Omnitrophica bacterium]|nr:SRPBCC family protein [Candidatus Omnitrophota bacterium]